MSTVQRILEQTKKNKEIKATFLSRSLFFSGPRSKEATKSSKTQTNHAYHFRNWAGLSSRTADLAQIQASQNPRNHRSSSQNPSTTTTNTKNPSLSPKFLSASTKREREYQIGAEKMHSFFLWRIRLSREKRKWCLDIDSPFYISVCSLSPPFK